MDTPIAHDLTTCAILARLAQGPDPEAWAVLVERHGDAVYQAAFRVTGEHALAEDATQETFLHIRGDAGRFRVHGGDADAAALGWITRIACTSALQLMRRRGRQRRHERHYAIEHARTRMDDEGHDPDPEEHAQLNEALRRELAELPESHRLPLLLHYCGGLDYQRIAEQIGCSAGNARVRVHRALERLRGRLARAGFAAGAASIVGQLHASEGASHLSPAMLAKCHALLASTQMPILSSSAVLGGTSVALKLGIAAASIALLGGISVPFIHHSAAPPSAPAVAIVQPEVPAPAVLPEAIVAPPPVAVNQPHKVRGIVLRVDAGERRLLLRDGDRIEGYVLHRKADGVPDSPESSDIARRLATVTVGSEVEVTWEPMRPPKTGDGATDPARHDAAAEVHRDASAPRAADGERPSPGGMHRWHHRWLVGLEIVTLAPPGQKPSGPIEKTDDL